MTGTPADGDEIEVEYVAEERGTIYPANPNGLIVTGWNLYNDGNGRARVLKYSEDPAECFGISGAYTLLAFSETLDGAQLPITVTDGLFSVPSDGFVWVYGGNGTDTAIWMTWEDWTEGYEGSWEGYTEHEVDFSNEMTTYFPNGLLKAGTAVDEINFNIGQAISRVERLAYSEANLAAAIATGREYEYDEDYIYLERATPVSNSISVSGAVVVDDHGLELVSQTDIPVTVEMLYGKNLKNELERNVLTISQQSLTDAQKTQVQQNIGVDSMYIVEVKTLFDDLSVAPSSFVSNTYSVAKQGYTPIGVVGYIVGNATHDGTSCTWITMNQMYVTTNNNVYVQFRNLHTSITAKIKIVADVWYVKNS